MRILRKNIYLIVTLFILVILAGGGTFILDKLLHLDSYKDQILVELQKSLNRKVTYEKGAFFFRFGASFSFTKVVILEKESTKNFMTADKLTFRIALLPLLQKKVVLTEMVLDRPQIFLERDITGRLNIGDLLEEKKEETPLHVKGIRIKKGHINYRDLAVGPDMVKIALEDTDLSLSHLERGKTCSFKLSTAALAGAGKRGTIILSGSARLAGREAPLSESRINASVQIKNLDAEHYWPYYRLYVPFNKVLGHLDLDSVFKGTIKEFTSKGSVRITRLRFDYPSVFHAILTPHDVAFSYDMECGPRDISVKSIDLNVDGLKVKGGCSILDIPSGDPRISAHASTSTFRLEDFHQYIPYGIIAHDASVYIEEHIKGGVYKLDDGKLDGRVSQILHMERGDNYNVLAIRGTVDKGLLTYGPDVPPFNNIKGDLEMKGKDFLLHRMTANFGGSPFTLEGKIADYPLDTPSSYPFDMTITPHQAEVSWLLGKDSGKKMTFAGESKLHLIGGGTTGGYSLSGTWNLSQAVYSYPDLVSKPAGRANHLAFKGSLNKQEVRITALQYDLAPMSLSLNAGYLFTGKNRLALEIKSNQFHVNEIAPMVPATSKYLPTGKVQAAINGESASGKVSDIHWGGRIAFSGFSFKPSERIKPVSQMNGAVTFKGTSLETSQIVARLGSSTVYCKGSMAGFTNPAISLAFSAPLLDFADLGLQAPGKEVKAAKVQGNITLKDHNLQIRSLSGQFGTSDASIKGTVQDINNPKIDISVTSSHLDMNDVMALSELEKTGRNTGQTEGLALNASVEADSGKILGMDFKNLTTDAVLDHGIIYLQSLHMKAMDGNVSGKVRFDHGSPSSLPRYQLSFDLARVSADRFMQTFGMNKQEITGTLSMQGELTAKGNSSAELKKTALGSLKFKFEKGSLKRFPVLSKIFSILNISQLFKFQLPDMVSGGMPYNSFTGTIAIQDGIVSSQDFYIASNAMNISAVGKVDLVKNEVDATIGVQALQTVGKVVNRLPVVGWILSGGNKTFLTTYFEAKGKLDDPNVKAIPVRSMAKGVFNIFKRVFELPGKLITDTGEVLIGN